jgi:hypothetical protein
VTEKVLKARKCCLEPCQIARKTTKACLEKLIGNLPRKKIDFWCSILKITPAAFCQNKKLPQPKVPFFLPQQSDFRAFVWESKTFVWESKNFVWECVRMCEKPELLCENVWECVKKIFFCVRFVWNCQFCVRFVWSLKHFSGPRSLFPKFYLNILILDPFGPV